PCYAKRSNARGDPAGWVRGNSRGRQVDTAELLRLGGCYGSHSGSGRSSHDDRYHRYVNVWWVGWGGGGAPPRPKLKASPTESAGQGDEGLLRADDGGE